MGLFSDVMGYIDSGRAATSISDANIAAEHGVLGANTQADQTLGGMMSGTAANLAPYTGAGAEGVQGLENYAASNPTFNFQPTQQQLEQTPGYQFQLQQGDQAVQNNASAQGLSQSGSTLKALTNYGQGLAGTYYQNAFNNALQSFQTNQNTTLQNMGTLINTGLSGTQMYDQTQMNGADLESQLGLQSAVDAGNFAVGAGVAHAGGIMSQGNNLSQGVGDLAGLIAQIPTGGGE